MARRLVPTLAAAVGVLVLLSMSVSARDVPTLEIGDQWAYEMEMELNGLELTGTATYSVDALSTTTVAGVVYDTYSVGFDSDLSISGEIEGVVVTGEATYTGIGYVEVEDLDEVKMEMNLSMTMEMVVLTIPIEMDVWEHSVTTYSPPGGTGEVPEDPEEGDTWVVTYTKHSDSTSYDGISIETYSDSETVSVSYLFVGVETVTVPAGTFECEVVQKDDGEDIETAWYSDEVGAEVKSVYESDGGMEVTLVLTAYDHEPAGSDGGMVLYMAMGAVLAVVVVVIIVALVLMRKKKPVTPQPFAPAPAPPADVPPPGPPPGAPPGPQ